MAEKTDQIVEEVSAYLSDLLTGLPNDEINPDADPGANEADQVETLHTSLQEHIQKVGETFDAIDEDCKALTKLASGSVIISEDPTLVRLPVLPMEEPEPHHSHTNDGSIIEKVTGEGDVVEMAVSEAKENTGRAKIFSADPSPHLDVFMDEQTVRLEEAQSLVSRLQREKTERKKRIERMQAKEIHRVLAKRRQQEVEQEKSKKTLEEERRREQQERHTREEAKRAERRRELEKNLSRCIRKKNRLHEKMAAGFHRSFQMEKEEERRKKLEQLKTLHKLPHREEIMAHQQWYHQNVRKFQKKTTAVSKQQEKPQSTHDAKALRRRLEYGQQVRCLHKPTRFKPFRKPSPPTEARIARQRGVESRAMRNLSSTAMIVHESVEERHGQREAGGNEVTELDLAEREKRTVARLQRLNAQIEHLHGHELKQAVATVDKISKVYVKRLQAKIAEYQKIVAQ